MNPITTPQFEAAGQTAEACRERLFEAIAKAPTDARYRLVEERLWDQVRDLKQQRNNALAAAIALRNGGGIDGHTD